MQDPALAFDTQRLQRNSFSIALDERIHQDVPRCSKIYHLKLNEILSFSERFQEVIPLDVRAVKVRVGIKPTLHTHLDSIDSDAARH